MYSKIVFVIAIAITFISCYDCRNEEIINKAKNAYIEIPIDSLRLLSPARNKDTSKNKGKYDLLVIHYSPLSSCSECEMQRLSIWREIMNSAKESGLNIEYRFIIASTPKQSHELIHYYNHNRIQLPIYLDDNNFIERINPLMRNSVFHSIIIDSKNKIVKIGDPSASLKNEEAFYAFLCEYRNKNFNKN